MRKTISAGVIAGVLAASVAGGVLLGVGRAFQPEGVKQEAKGVLDLTVKRLDGSEQDLSAYKGKVVLIVNVASKCGFTRQYAALETLYEDRKDDGLVILGFPANDFGGQEPGSNKEIATFCKDRFGVTFPMFEKIRVTGEAKHELYKRLAGLPAPLGGEPRWNFTKFLVNRSGEVVARFEPSTAPDDEKLIERVSALLAEKAPEAPATPEG